MTAKPLPAQSAPGAAPALAADAAESLENRYYAYLRMQGYSSSDALNDVLKVYLPHLKPFARVGDLGCGHGEFLTLLRAQGHTVSGVDVDPGMVAAARAAGFDVAQGDAVEWLNARPQSLDAIFSSNVVEHLPPETVRAWLGAALRALTPGGMVLFATPNPESAVVHLYEFWRDPTHVRLYNRQLLEFMLVDSGFERVSSQLNPASAWEGPDVMLAGVAEPLPPLPPLAHPAAVPELPAQLGAEFPAWKRALWRLTQPFYRALTAPFVEPIRHTTAQHTQSLEQARAALEQAQAQANEVAQRLSKLDAATRFLYPPREYYVVGYKPGPPPPSKTDPARAALFASHAATAETDASTPFGAAGAN